MFSNFYFSFFPFYIRFIVLEFWLSVCLLFTNSGKFRQESFSDDFDAHPERIFQATIGNRCYTWSFKSWEESHNQTTTNGFEWRDRGNWNDSKYREWQNASDIESDDESYVVGSSSDRTILGLPPKGPLKIEDVKIA